MKLKIVIEDKLYEVDVEVSEAEPRPPSYIPPAGRTAPAASVSTPVSSTAGPVKDENKVCRSPVTGVVVRVSAQVGQTIQADDALMVLEAMKMETEITSPVGGTVAKVNANVGDSVQGGQVLIEFE